MIYYIADNHFGDARIMRLANRPFATVKDMDNAMISLWNRKVGDNDEVYIVGDFALDSQCAISSLKKLNGRKILIFGNHDMALNKEALRYFDRTATIDTIKDGPHSVTLCHYPLLSYENSIYDGYHVFGHIHNNPHDAATELIKTFPRHLHCGADVTGFTPQALHELIRSKKASVGIYRNNSPKT